MKVKILMLILFFFGFIISCYKETCKMYREDIVPSARMYGSNDTFTFFYTLKNEADPFQAVPQDYIDTLDVLSKKGYVMKEHSDYRFYKVLKCDCEEYKKTNIYTRCESF